MIVPSGGAIFLILEHVGIQTQPMVKTLSLDSGCVGVELLFVELEETDRKTWIAGRAEAPAFRPLFRLTYGMMS